MNNNPLWMKWFVSGVQAGARPEDLLADPTTFLDFSMSNVYQHLSPTSLEVLQTFQVSAGRKSQAQLAFLTGLAVENLQDALGELCASNMVTMASTPTGSSFETHYQLGDLAKTYLGTRHPVTKAVHARVTKRDRQLVAAGEELRRAQKENPYQIKSLDLRSSGNLIVARHLLDALDSSRRGAFEQADTAVKTAKLLTPEWYEVHRVEALVQARQGNVTAAQDAFDCAIELESASAPLRLRYGMFKLDHMDDPEGAVEELEAALKLDPRSADLKLAMVRAQQRNLDFEASRQSLNELLASQADLSVLKLRMLYDLELQHWLRLSDMLSRDGDHERASRALATLSKAFHECPSRLRDGKIRGRLPQALPTARRILKYCYDDDVRRRVKAFVTWVESGQWTDSAEPNELGIGARGTIVKLVSERGYGFIRLRDADEVFFHFSDLEFPHTELRVGLTVTCDLRWTRLSRGL